MAQLVKAFIAKPELDLWDINGRREQVFTNLHVHTVACMNVPTHFRYTHKYIQIIIYFIYDTHIYKYIIIYGNRCYILMI